MISVKLLGQFEVLHDGKLVDIPTRNAQFLLAYLAMHTRQPQRREKLAGILWPDTSEENARSNLRHELWRLRKVLDGEHSHISGNNLVLSFDPQCGYALDVDTLTEISVDSSSVDELSAALSVYQGELLPGLYDKWVLAEREQVFSAFETRCARLLELLTVEERWPEIRDWSSRWISLGSWPEPAYRALMLAYAGTGERAKATAAYHRLEQGLRKDLGLEPSEQTRALYRRIKSGANNQRPIDTRLASSPAPTHTGTQPEQPSPRQHSSNLPHPLTSFIGRSREIHQIVQLVSTSRLVTITGPAGVGKTRLAIQAARELSERFRDGVWWVELAGLNPTTVSQSETSAHPAATSRPDGMHLVSQAVIHAFRIIEIPGQPLLEGMIESLHDRKLLIVLDNCEHLIAACAYLAGLLLDNCPELTILATSRESLNVPGEKSWEAPVLSLPPPGRAEPQDFLASEAARLFVERAADARPEYHPDDNETTAIATICLRLDGIPLAIELAAARMNIFSTAEIAARLDQRFSLLTGGYRTALPRHQTLQAAIDWSYNLLAENEQTLFRRLSIFPGSFTLEAGEAICVDPEIPGEDFISLIGRIVDKSLLQVEPAAQDPAQPTRYRFLNSIHTYGRIKLEESGEAGQMHRQHACYYVQLVEAAEPELLAQNQVQWFKRLDAETDNLRAVIEWSSETGEVESALRLVGALLWFWFSYGSTREGCELSMRAIAASMGGHFPASRARALNTAGFLLCLLGDTLQARQLLEEALSIHRSLQDRAMLAWTLQFLGLALAYDQEYDRADLVFNEGLAYAQSPEGPQGNNFLHFRGDIDMLRGDYPRARKVYEESAGMLRSIGSRSFLAYPLRRLGYLDLWEQDFRAAAQCFRESLEINRTIGDQRAVVASLASLAALAVQIEKPSIAARLFGFVENQIDTRSVKLLYTDQLAYKQAHSELLNSLDERASRELFNDGWTMSEDQAVELGEQVFASFDSPQNNRPDYG